MVVIIYLVVRAIAGMAAAFAQPAAFVLVFAAGMLLSSFPGMAGVSMLPLTRVALESSAGLLLFSFASGTLQAQSTSTIASWRSAGLFRRFAVLALPAATVLVPAIGNLVFPGTFTAGTIRLGLILCMAIWLSRDGRPLDLVMAAGSWLLLDSGSLLNTGTWSAGKLPGGIPSGSALPYLLLIASGGLIVALNRVVNTKPGSPSRNLARDGRIALSAMMAISLRLLGTNWGPAALTAGIVAGFAGRNRQQRDDAAPARFLTYETGLICCFAIGLGMGLADYGVHPASTAIIAVAFLFIPVVRGLLYSENSRTIERMTSLLPASATPFAMILFSGIENSELRSMAFGLAIACLAALSAAGFSSSGTTGTRRSTRTWKPLVAVSRRGNAAGILAFASALADPDQPIRSVCVAAAPGSQGPDAAEAEETLVRAVAAGASSGYRILPSMVTAASTSDGLARAALERRSDCIVVGWNENPTPSDPGSRSIVDSLVHLAPANVITVRKPEIFGHARRLVFVTMAGSMPESGYREAAALAIAAWGGKPSGLEAMVIGGAVDELATALGLEDSQITAIPVWRDLPEAVHRGGTHVPAFFVAAARPDWPGWNPGTERIPLVLQDSYPDSALAVFYLKAPPVAGEGSDDETGASTIPEPERIQSTSSGSGPEKQLTASGSDSLRNAATTDVSSWPPIIQIAIQSGRIMTSMKEAVLIDAIATLAKALFPTDRTAASRMASDFSSIARTEPIELAPGMLLLHAHSKGIAVPALAIGVNKDGWRLVALESPVRIIIMLVSPMEAGPAAHLEALTQIAKAIRDHGFAQAILDPERVKEFSPASTP
jgi:mannitol/fructose-specific phosphotransferase system IIA component (Ntr-type)